MPTTRLSQQFSAEPPSLLAQNSLQTVSSLVAASCSTTATNSPVDDGKKAFGLQEIHEPEPYKLDQLLFGM